ncbi:DUF5057 domain-containing protein [Saccharibacillus kuerlensis]|uniref:Choice-of-anchor A domain-containing protein n=1 Tax=Saccharibacillus kuerlensis TaxID=459527 RepID=A0ABQ2KTW6_9BACL|nr:DUF5057 domain-containing protein [Saccharibacillus kuerlensis]GGN93079.1 hypothetical protein GCM10010969_06240 [Saccharibacillus kuerlensis]
MRKKHVGIWIIILTFVLVSVPFGVWKVMADTEPPYQIKILEIVDNGTYALQSSLKDTPNVVVDTMRMKTFVAMRDELNGKYDTIYFGKGTYSTAQPQTFTSTSLDAQRQAHHTTSIMNDMTKLKAQEIENDYIQKGLPVIFHTSIHDQNPQGNLYALYSKYKMAATSPSNVIFTNDTSLGTVINDIKKGTALYKQRPQIEIVAKPENSLTGSAKIYTTGDTLTFTFNANNIKDFNSPVNAKLYIGVDKVLKLTDENIVASSTLTARSGNLTYKLPQTFSGPVYWRLELNANGLSDYTEGAVHVRDKQTVIRVLQVLPKDSASSLIKSSNMTQSYLQSPDYDIQITPIPFSEFNTASNPNSYANLNGKYDMVIFGFMDNYNKQTSSSLTDAAAAGINTFIKTGQAVMFTHDTMIGNMYNPWIKNFQQTTGQTGLYTNMGLSAPNRSTRTQIVNSGMLTQFPFDLSLKPGNTNGYVGQIAQTHNQYYMLDLEDPSIVPWYNIVSEDADTHKRDSDDSYDHYYTYSKGNVTYSGTGHTNTGFPEWEQKLFVNTMFRAFIGSNHAPTITVYAPEENSTKPSYLKNLILSYQVDDLDLKDLNVYSTVKIKSNGVELDTYSISEKMIQKGQIVTETIPNPLPTGGTLQIEITARDKQGASVTKTIDMTIEQVSANLETDRTIVSGAPNKVAVRGEPVVIDYSVTPLPIDYSLVRQEEQGSSTLEVSNLIYTEKLPAGLEISGSLPAGMNRSGTLAEGYTLTTSFGDVTYNLTTDADGSKSYQPTSTQPLSFTLNLVPTQKGPYDLNAAKLDFEDLHVGQSSISEHDSALQTFKDYSLFIFGNADASGSSFGADGRLAFGGNVTLSSFNAGKQLQTGSLPTVLANGSVSISGGSITNGSIVAGTTMTLNGLSLNGITAVSGDSMSIANGSIQNGAQALSGEHLSLSNFNVNEKSTVAAVKNLTLSSEGNIDLSSSASYGGTYNGPIHIVPQKKSASTLKAQVNAAKQTIDFAAAKKQLLALSDAYAAKAATGTTEYKEGRITLTGTEKGLNIFNVSGSYVNTMNHLVINVPSGSTAVVNISGSNTKLSNGMTVNGTDSAHVILNFNQQTGIEVTNIKVKGSILAPRAAASFRDGNIEGTLIADSVRAPGSFHAGMSTFVGSSPAVVTTGEQHTILYPDEFFNAVVKVNSIALEDRSIWVGDSTTLVPTILPTDVEESGKILTWSSSSPAVQIVYPSGTVGGKAPTISVVGAQAGEAVITASATDGSGIVGRATIKVEAPALSIIGTPSVNVGQTITDIQAVVNASNLKIDSVDWEWSSTGAGKVNISPQTDPTQLFVEGVQSGRVKLQATAHITNTKTRMTKQLTATYDIDVTDNLSSVVINGPDAVKKGGTINLSTEIQPAAANIGSIVWNVTEGQSNANLTPASTAPPRTAVLKGTTAGPVTISVTVRTAGDNPVEKTVTKTIWVLDFAMKGPDTVYAGDSIDLSASLLPANYPGSKGTVEWSISNVPNSGPGNASYASIGTPVDSGNTSSVSLSGSSSGQVIVTAVIPTPAGNLTVSQPVTIRPVVTALLLPPTVKVEKGVPFDLIANAPLMVNPISIPVEDIKNQLVWTSADDTSISVDTSGVVVGLQEGREIVVTVSYQRTATAPAITASTRVIVTKAADPNAPSEGDRY